MFGNKKLDTFLYMRGRDVFLEHNRGFNGEQVPILAKNYLLCEVSAVFHLLINTSPSMRQPSAHVYCPAGRGGAGQDGYRHLLPPLCVGSLNNEARQRWVDRKSGVSPSVLKVITPSTPTLPPWTIPPCQSHYIEDLKAIQYFGLALGEFQLLTSTSSSHITSPDSGQKISSWRTLWQHLRLIPPFMLDFIFNQQAWQKGLKTGDVFVGCSV